MRISIFGIGYVGITSAACLAKFGHEIVCVDIDPAKVEMINKGQSIVHENHLKQIVHENWEKGRIWATLNPKRAVEKTDVSIISVGTPVDANGRVNLRSVFNTFDSIGEALREKDKYHLIVLRSTSPPGTTRKGLKITEKTSGKKLGSDFGGCMNPEFLREWFSVQDFYNPPFVIIGQYDEKSGSIAEELNRGIDAELIRTGLEVAEMIKYSCNAFHALKVTFANEIGRICKETGIDARKVMDIFVKDTKLNLSSSYLKPGSAFGGSCLPKDLRAIVGVGRDVGAKTPLLDSILVSNSSHIEYVVDRIEKVKTDGIGIIGLAYHKNTDDLRESQIIELIKRLIEKGYKVSVYDDNVKLDELFGSNRDYVESLPFSLECLITPSLEDLVRSADVIIIAHNRPDVKNSLRRLPQNKYVLDLAGLYNSEIKPQKYEGICW